MKKNLSNYKTKVMGREGRGDGNNTKGEEVGGAYNGSVGFSNKKKGEEIMCMRKQERRKCGGK